MNWQFACEIDNDFDVLSNAVEQTIEGYQVVAKRL
jgi:hypothetical protein